MIKKILKKRLIFTMIALLLFSSITAFAADDTHKIKRLYGSDRYATSVAIALSGWTQSNYAILASGENFPDAISAAPLAKKYDAPILLSRTDSIPEETLSAIQQLKVKNVIIIGGAGSISSEVEKQLAASGLVVTRIFGQDRYETCIKIAEQLGDVTEIAVVTGESFPDALSISPIAVKRNMPIILVNHNEIPSVVKDYVNNHKLTTTYVIGSGTSLNNVVLKGLSNIELITGNDKYQINYNIIDKFKSDLNLSTTYIASGENFPDALSGSILAGKKSNPLLLVGGDSSYQKDYFNNNSANISDINILGGTGVISEEVINKIIGKNTTSLVDKIEFTSTNLTKTGDSTATFQYKVLDKNGTDITKNIPASELSAVASVSSSIALNPLTGVGTITFKSSSDTDKPVITTLVDLVNGIVGTREYSPIDSGTKNTSEAPKISKIMITSTVLGIGVNSSDGTPGNGYATYKILDQNGNDITNSAIGNNITFVSSVGTVSARNGLITIVPDKGVSLLTYKTVSITAVAIDTGITTSEALSVGQ